MTSQVVDWAIAESVSPLNVCDSLESIIVYAELPSNTFAIVTLSLNPSQVTVIVTLS